MNMTPGGLGRKNLPDIIPGAVFVDTQHATLTSLQSDRAKRDVHFAGSIIRAYVKAKIQSGKPVEDVDKKLDALHKEIVHNKLGPFDDEIQDAKEFIRTSDASVPSHSKPYVDEDEAAKGKGYWRTGPLGKWT